MEPADLIRSEQELLALTGVQDASGLADALWDYVDGVVYFHPSGIDLQPGFQHEGLSYPFTLQSLFELAQRLEESEVLLQAAAGAPKYPTADTDGSVGTSPVRDPTG